MSQRFSSTNAQSPPAQRYPGPQVPPLRQFAGPSFPVSFNILWFLKKIIVVHLQ